jgi:nicotinate-nucleotide adenylyltransferase
MRIGIFGGTFDPPHVGHLILADEARSQLELDQVFWVLTPFPPHKQDIHITSLDIRLEMLKLTIWDDPDFVVSRVEMDREGPHYAVDTMKGLSKMYPDSELIYLMGGDSLKDLTTWHRPSAFVAACNKLGVMGRPGSKPDLSKLEKQIPGIGEKVRLIEAPMLEISSSEIRQRITAGRPFRHFLTPEVYRFIVERGLYLNRS